MSYTRAAWLNLSKDAVSIPNDCDVSEQSAQRHPCFVHQAVIALGCIGRFSSVSTIWRSHLPT